MQYIIYFMNIMRNNYTFFHQEYMYQLDFLNFLYHYKLNHNLRQQILYFFYFIF
jgi:hypothetical protein